MESASESEFHPSQEYLEQLMGMGISQPVALEALFCTNNESVEAAINFVFNNPSGEFEPVQNLDVTYQRHSPIPCSEGDVASVNLGGQGRAGDNPENKSYKMTFVVNTSLSMTPGKIAAQVAHSCLGLYRQMAHSSELNDAIILWEEIGEKKIVLKGETTEHLQQLYSRAEEANVPCYLVTDAGHTQVPVGSVTVLSLFGEDDKVDQITGALSLL